MSTKSLINFDGLNNLWQTASPVLIGLTIALGCIVFLCCVSSLFNCITNLVLTSKKLQKLKQRDGQE
jgi:hypothetical protein